MMSLKDVPFSKDLSAACPLGHFREKRGGEPAGWRLPQIRWSPAAAALTAAALAP